MGRREQIRGRLEAAEAAKPGRWEVRGGFPSNVYVAGSHRIEGFVAYAPHAADLIANAPSDLRDLLAVADAAARLRHSPYCATNAIGDHPCDCTAGPVLAALDRLDNGGDR